MSSFEINDSLNFTYINSLVNEFYEFMGKSYIEYKDKNIVIVNNSINSINSINTIENDITKVKIEDTEKPITQTFSDYFLFKLFYNSFHFFTPHFSSVL